MQASIVNTLFVFIDYTRQDFYHIFSVKVEANDVTRISVALETMFVNQDAVFATIFRILFVLYPIKT